MRYRNVFFALIFSIFVFAGGLVLDASAQRRGGVSVQGTSRRPVVIRRQVYRSPFWRSRWGYSRFHDPFYDPYFNSPYLRYQDQKYRLQNELAGNRRELNEHLRKYRADGVITAKEQRELDDDYKDVRESTQRLQRFNREY